MEWKAAWRGETRSVAKKPFVLGRAVFSGPLLDCDFLSFEGSLRPMEAVDGMWRALLLRLIDFYLSMFSMNWLISSGSGIACLFTEWQRLCSSKLSCWARRSLSIRCFTRVFSRSIQAREESSISFVAAELYDCRRGGRPRSAVRVLADSVARGPRDSEALL